MTKFWNNVVISVTFVAITFLLVCGIFFMLPKNVDAQIGLGTELLPGNFGGRVLASRVCTCTEGCLLLYIGPPKGGFKIWCPPPPPGTLTFMFWTIAPYRWQLGLQGLVMPCMMSGPWYCYMDGGGNYMFMTGTSFLN